MSVGRLDLDSEGMILLTNDGSLARHLELPNTGYIRKYRVRIYGRVDEKQLEKLKDGITIDGIHYGSLLARLDKQLTSNAWLTIAIKEGKNREIRRVMEYLGYSVSRLIRTSYGPFQLGNMKEDDLKEVKQVVLREQLGQAVKKAAGNRRRITRYASTMIPMDETLSRVSVDISNRPYLIWKVDLKVEKLGEMDTELFKEWFQAFSQSAGITLHVENIYGENSHHKVESCYKGLARSLKDALAIDSRIKNSIPSTKGKL